MKTKTIVITFASSFLVIGLFIWGYAKSGDIKTPIEVSGIGGSHPANAENRLTASEMFYDFGVIRMKDGEVTKEFTVTNSTNQDIKVKTILTSCMCTSAFIVRPDGSVKGPFQMAGMGYVPPANETIKAGESRIIRVVYDPNAHGPAGVGQIDRIVTLTDSSGEQLQLRIKALVKP